MSSPFIVNNNNNSSRPPSASPSPNPQRIPKHTNTNTNHHEDDDDEDDGVDHSSTLSPHTLPSSSLSGSMKANVVNAASYELHEDVKTDVATDVKRRAQGFLDTLKHRTAMIRQNLTTQAWLFIVNVVLSVLILLGCCAALLYEAFNNAHRDSTVGSEYGLNLCSFQVFTISLASSASYSISDLMIGCFFALWYAFRAVRHEKEALLVVFALCVLGVLGRALYFAFVTAFYWVSGLSLVTLQVFLCLGSVGLIIAVAQTWRVGRSFGWRMYAKGVASVADVKRMGKLKTLDAAAKLDLFLTINAFNTFFFFSPDATIRYLGFAFTAVTALFLLAIPGMVKHQMFFLAYIFAVVGLVLPAFYIFLLVSIFGKDPNHCFEEELTNCAASSNITQVSRFLNFTSFPSLFNSTGCVACRNETSYDPNRLCWTNTMSLSAYASSFNVSQLSDNNNNNNVSVQNAFLDVCLSVAESKIDQCCQEFGKCELKTKLVDSNAPMAVFVVICAIMTRLATMWFGVQQARLMNVPSVEEMMARGSRTVSNALSFQFLGSQSPPSTARIRNLGDHEEDDQSSRSDHHHHDQSVDKRTPIFTSDYVQQMIARDKAESELATTGDAGLAMMILSARNNSNNNNNNIPNHKRELEVLYSANNNSNNNHIGKKNGGGVGGRKGSTPPPEVAAVEQVDSGLPTPRYELAFAERRR